MHVQRVLFEGTRAVGVRGQPARPAAGAARRARGDPLRRRLQLAAAADALRRRPGRAPDDARNRGAARPAGGRREPLRPRGRATPCGRRPSRRACCSRSSRRRWRSTKPTQTGPFASNFAEAGGFARVGAGRARARHPVPLRAAADRRRGHDATPKPTACGSRRACSPRTAAAPCAWRSERPHRQADRPQRLLHARATTCSA